MKSNKKFNGAISALTTPFDHGKIDYTSLKKLTEYQLKNGINGFVVNGTTAESPTLTWAEVETIYKHVRDIAGSQFPIIIGTGSNSTQETIEKTKKAEGLGADAALVVVPYYNKPPQRGLVAHFSAVAECAQLPVILYNVPGRTITAMTEETIISLSNIKNIIGIKEASGDIAFDQSLKKNLNENFTLLSGDDATFIDFLKLGGDGIISVMSNAITSACANWLALASNNQFDEAAADFNKYKDIISLMYIEANPIPVKWMLYKMGLFKSAEMRLPLVELDAKYFNLITDEMLKIGMIQK